MFSSPAVKPGELFFYFDPLDTLSEESQARWLVPGERAYMLENARREAQVDF